MLAHLFGKDFISKYKSICFPKWSVHFSLNFDLVFDGFRKMWPFNFFSLLLLLPLWLLLFSCCLWLIAFIRHRSMDIDPLMAKR